MIDHTSTIHSGEGTDSLLVIGAPASSAGASWVHDLKTFYPQWSHRRSDSFLSAIADIARRPAQAVIARVDPGLTQWREALAGLREAAGPQTKLVLCGPPESEPLAREALGHGADDYVLFPLRRREVDAALGVARVESATLQRLSGPPAATMEELTALSRVLAEMDVPPRVFVERLADLVRLALSAEGVTLVVEGTAATAGDVVTRAVLTAALMDASGPVGQVLVGNRTEGSYTPGDAAKLEHYATLLGHLLGAAARHRALRRASLTDPCSGLPNRRYLEEQLDALLERARAEQFPITLLLFDLDDFKRYNDIYGHAAGDAIIRGTGDLFRRHCREQDVVTRYGGDEFAVIFWDPQGPRSPGSRHPGSALSVLDRVQAALRQHAIPFIGPAARGQLTISGGLATFPWDGATREELLLRADEALLAAKRAGKNRIFLIGGDLQQDTSKG